jgi:conjugative transposon TraN protein
MKKNCAIAIGIILSFLLATKSNSQIERTSFIQSYHLDITCNKTTNLIFPFSIVNVDRGSKDILVQKVTVAENILQVKADKPNFLETNLSVITADGNLYSFTVDYFNEPLQLNIVFEKDTLTYKRNQQTIFSSNYGNAAELNTIARNVFNFRRTIYGIKDKHESMLLSLNGIYVNNDIFYFQLLLKNKSQVSYNINVIRFFIRDKKKSKRTAVQEMEIRPLYVYGNDTTVEGTSSQLCVIALPKFTLSADKYLLVRVLEKNGGRELNIRVKNRHILQAQNPSIENTVTSRL